MFPEVASTTDILANLTKDNLFTSIGNTIATLAITFVIVLVCTMMFNIIYAMVTEKDSKGLF